MRNATPHRAPRDNRYSRPLRAGDFVEVCSFAEISTTLDARGELDGLPFMPEMLAYCGRRFEVWKRADKTCDEAAGGAIRRLKGTVHLKELRCSGEAHGGCDAGCLLFWRERWLKRVVSLNAADAAEPAEVAGFSVDAIERATRYSGEAPADGEELYLCQSTEISRFSQPLPWWDVSQYVRDLYTRNVTILEFLGGVLIGIFNKIQGFRGRSEFGLLSGANTKTPQTRLDLCPGDFVQIKSRNEIMATLDRRGKNRGLAFRPMMASYCGSRSRVVRRVKKIVDPGSRRLISLGGNSVILEGVVCSGKMKRFCPRMVYPYWRDIWLTAVTPTQPACGQSDDQIDEQITDTLNLALAEYPTES